MHAVWCASPSPVVRIPPPRGITTVAGKQHQFSLRESGVGYFYTSEERELRPLLHVRLARIFLAQPRTSLYDVREVWLGPKGHADRLGTQGQPDTLHDLDFIPSITPWNYRSLLSATLRLPPFGSPQLLATTPDLPAASGGTTVRFTTL